MLSHDQIWRGVDALARRSAVSTSGLARLAGLDPTTFNKSKRVTARGKKPRWPSTESIAKALEATGVSFLEFALLAGGEEAGPTIPFLSFAEAGRGDHFDAQGRPTGKGWSLLPCPGATATGAFALELDGDALAPLYRDGDRIIAAPDRPLRPGDRVLVKTRRQELLAEELAGVMDSALELRAFASAGPAHRVALDEVSWVARIVWVSQ